MRDRYGRKIEYLRVSVTQNCNLKCIYCVPDRATAKLAGQEEVAAAGSVPYHSCAATLKPEEFEAIIRGMAELGIKKVRITGGEPLTRPDICEIVSRTAAIPGIADLSMTTNGVCLDKMADDLKRAGLRRLNISLDSLKKDRFEYITGGGRLNNVLDGIDRALEVGLEPIKINTVLIKGVNDGEVDDFINLTKDRPVEVRFIELMPIGKFGEDNRDNAVLNSHIIASHPELVLCEDNKSSLPAQYYSIKGYKGKIGFISSLSHKFCSSCNRIRLTCDGKIKPCLGNNGEVDIVEILRTQPQKLAKHIRDIIFNKPEGHNFDKKYTSTRNMNAIGG
ncbi:MAG: GTP 3',8-cyclase MoaA [Clostridia bacterium]|nr:GTP 3',8-cyclase MoaA [Clostridia bacterium]